MDTETHAAAAPPVAERQPSPGSPPEGKAAEIDYVQRMSSVLGVSVAEVRAYLGNKPFSDAARWRYLLDLGQVFRVLPPAPARILDLGVGPGWTSIMLARSGYQVVGVDIAPDMIALAVEHAAGLPNLELRVVDYEQSLPYGEFDAVLIYDALHHANDEGAVIANAHAALKAGGLLVTIEPGAGHSTSEDSRQMMERFGTTEKDMEHARQARLMQATGFRDIKQYLRLSELPLESLQVPGGPSLQSVYFAGLLHNTIALGFSSIVVATK